MSTTTYDTTQTRHPKGLRILFFTEMWERFSYYGMRALLVLYLVNSLEYDRANALEIYATYTALVYLTPILGGYFADRYLGSRQAILIGGIIMALGHFAMAFEGLLYMGLGLLVVGNGFFKPNISTMVGQLYSENDPRRDGGFTLFYMGINLGAFFSPLVCGTLAHYYGWHYGFAAAGVGMVLGIIIFLYGQKYLNLQTAHQDPPIQWGTVLVYTVIATLSIGLVLTLWPTLSHYWQQLETWLQIWLPILFAITLIYLALKPDQANAKEEHSFLTPTERDRIIAIFILALFVIFFWMGFEQAGGTMNLFADKQIEREFLNWTIPTSYFQSLNPLFILMLAPLFAIFWFRLERSPYALSTPAKMALGLIILGLAFVVMAIAQEQAEIQGKVSPLWLVVVYLLFTMGELCLSPIGLSMVTKLAAVRFVSLMMGLWFAAIAVANYVAGTLEALIEHWHLPLYWFLVSSSLAAGFLLLLLTPLLKRLMHGVN